MKHLATWIVALLLSSIGVRAVVLAWNGSTNATGYKLYYGPAHGIYTNATDCGARTQSTNHLSPGIYFLAVTAYNGAGESSFSTELIYTQSVVYVSAYLESALVADGPWLMRTNWTFVDPILTNQFYRMRLGIVR